MNQNTKVLMYMEEHGSIDGWRAQTDLRIMRLSARIHDLRAAGHVIIGETKYSFSPEYGKTHWTEYRIKEPPRVETERPGEGNG